MSKRDTILERVRKLLNLADGKGASQGEIENAMAAARRLMDQWNIDEAELIMSDTAQDHIKRGKSVSQPGFSGWERELAVVVAMVTDTQAIFLSRGSSIEISHRIDFVGFSSDVAIADALYRLLLTEIRALSVLRCGKRGWQPKHSQYCVGVVQGLYKRAVEMRHRNDHSEANALVLRKDLVINDWIRDHVDVVGTTVGVNQMDSDWTRMGKHDSKDVSLDTRGLSADEAAEAEIRALEGGQM